MKVKDIIKVIEEFAPLSFQEGWDNSGLCVGSGEDEVSSILLALDCTPELVDEAVACGADMIVTHHPLIFSGLKRISSDDLVGKAVIKAVKAGMSIYAAHTNADKVIEGVSGAMAARLGLVDVQVLSDEGDGIGLAAVGNLPAPMTPEQVLALVKERFALKVVKISRLVEGEISRIAMCGGSGGSLIGAARKSGAQLYISGDISYHNYFTGEGFMVMDIGHYESEENAVFAAWYPLNAVFEDRGINTVAHSMAFTVADNRRLDELKQRLSEFFAPASTVYQGGTKAGLIIDEALFRDQVTVLERGIILLQIVRMLILALSIGISFLVAYLNIRGRRLELAVMRSMGTRRAALYTEVLREHTLFCLLGVLIAAGGVTLLGTVPNAAHWRLIGQFTLCYLFGVALAVAQVTSGKIMQTLKGKE